jgi:hypothetical protein
MSWEQAHYQNLCVWACASVGVTVIVMVPLYALLNGLVKRWRAQWRHRDDPDSGRGSPQ